MPHFRMSALNFFPPIIKKHVWRTCCCRLPLWAGCWGERRDNTCGLEQQHSRSANNLLSLKFKTSPLARAANKLTEDSAWTNSRRRGWDVLQRKRRAGKIGRVQLKCDGTRWRTGGEVKGKLAIGVGSQYSSQYLGTWCIQHCYRWRACIGCQ